MTAAEIARMVTDGSRRAFEDNGYVEPTLVMVGENFNGIALHPNPAFSERPPIAYAEVVFRIGRLHPWRMIATSSETWARAYPMPEESEEARRDMRVGGLERRAKAGDPTVDTALVVAVLDLFSLPDSTAILSTARRGDDGTLGWDEDVIDGVPEGDLTEFVLNAYAASPEPPFIVGQGLIPLQIISDVLVEAQLATYARVLEAP